MKNFPPEKCTACGACMNACPVNAISWKLEKHQVEMPSVDASLCISCEKCIKICPQNTAFDGKYPSECYAAWMKESADLEKSASGGAARAFSRTILEQGGVVFGCISLNGKVKHVAVRSLEELDLLSGSKYVWSDTEQTFGEAKAALEENIPVLYIGTPCQIDGLKHYLGKAYDNLFLVDLICHGVPPASYINDYVEKTFGGKAKEVSFRNRNGAILSGTLESGERFIQKKEGSFEDPYMQAYISGLIYRENCHSCRYANPERVSDITIGDFWGIKPDRLPKDAPELKSVIYVNTDNGKKLLEKSAAQLHLIPYLVIEGVFGKDNVKRPQSRPPHKDYFYEQLEHEYFTKALDLTNKIKNPQCRSLRRFLSGLEKSVSTFFCRIYNNFASEHDNTEKPLVQIATIEEYWMLRNYGTIFQHYALRTFLRKKGYAVCRKIYETETYCQENESYVWWRSALFCKLKLKQFLVLFLAYLKLIKRVSYPIVYYSLIRPILFRRFYTKYIGRWVEPISKSPDFYLVGGDQVFLFNLDNGYNRFLPDVDNRCRKITYAGSADWEKLRASGILKNQLHDILTQYYAIGVREHIGKSIISELCPEKNISVTIDPVLLLTREEYISMITEKKYFKKPTLLCYLLNCSRELLHLDVLIQIAEILSVDLKIIGIQDTEQFIPREYAIIPSPTDFLRAFRDASYIITNSFHGTVFSALFEKKWVTIPQRDDLKDPKNIRQIEFLDSIQCSERFINYSVPGITDIMNKNIDWDNVKKQISILRQEGADWLWDILKENNK